MFNTNILYFSMFVLYAYVFLLAKASSPDCLEKWDRLYINTRIFFCLILFSLRPRLELGLNDSKELFSHTSFWSCMVLSTYHFGSRRKKLSLLMFTSLLFSAQGSFSWSSFILLERTGRAWLFLLHHIPRLWVLHVPLFHPLH